MFKRFAICILMIVVFGGSVLANQDVRIVPVKVVVDENFVKIHSTWQKIVNKTIEGVSEFYKQEFGIELRVASIEKVPVADFKPRPNESEIHDHVLAVANTVIPQDEGVVICFSSRKQISSQGPRGCVDKIQGSYILLCDSGKIIGPRLGYQNNLIRILQEMMAHELAHIFGVRHQDERIMLTSSELTGKKIEFPDQWKQIITQNKLVWKTPQQQSEK